MKFRFLSVYLLTALAIWGAILPLKTFAASASSILVSVIPENPAPSENVSISLNSYASNLDSVLISWTVDGKTMLSGIGKKSFSLTAPAAGSETSVVANISLPDGAIDRRIIIRPTVMAMLWQANDSYVPPFYKGKAMPTPDSEVKIVAMPEIKSGSKMMDPKNMTYSWKKDYANAQGDSGYAKNFFIYINDYLEDSNNINVVASTTDQKYSSEGSIDVRTYQPKIIFYKNDSSLGTLWEQSLSNGHKITNDEVVEAAPYFISPQNIKIPSLSFQWSINDLWTAVDPSRKNLLPLKVQPGVSGTSRIKLEIENIYKIFATASKEIRVEF